MAPDLDAIACNDLQRSDYRFELRADDDESGDGFTIDGYATVYDAPTRIDSWEGMFDEEFSFGAFRKSIRERLPRMQFDHGMHPTIGSLPIGLWRSVTEEKPGLHTVGRMHGNWLVEPVRDAIREGSVDGMSIRFSVVREVWTDVDGKTVKPEDVLRLLYEPGDRGPLHRTIKEAKISEAGPVVWPAYQQTSVGVRSKVTIDLARLTDPDQRRTLARAVLLADAANRNTDSSTDAPQHDQAAPDEHPADDAAPPADPPSPEQHPSAEARQRRDRIRAAAHAHKGYLLNLEGA